MLTILADSLLRAAGSMRDLPDPSRHEDWNKRFVPPNLRKRESRRNAMNSYRDLW